MTPENELPLGDNHRIAIYRQEDAESPFNLYDLLGCFPTNVAWGYNGFFSGDKNILEELTRLARDTEAGSPKDLEQELTDYLVNEHGMRVMPFSLRGYSQSEWMDVILWMSPENGTDIADEILKEFGMELDAYFKGDVFYVQLEQLVTYYGPNGKTISRWEALDGVDTMGECYFHERPTAEELCRILEIDPTDYGVDSAKVKFLDLVN